MFNTYGLYKRKYLADINKRKELCMNIRKGNRRVLCKVIDVMTCGVIIEVVCYKDAYLISIDEATESNLILYAEKDYRFHAQAEFIDNKFTGILEYELDKRFALQQNFDVEDYLNHKINGN